MGDQEEGAHEGAHAQAAGEVSSQPPADRSAAAAKNADKVVILAKNVANAPILKTTQFSASASHPFSKVIQHIQVSSCVCPDCMFTPAQFPLAATRSSYPAPPSVALCIVFRGLLCLRVAPSACVFALSPRISHLYLTTALPPFPVYARTHAPLQNKIRMSAAHKDAVVHLFINQSFSPSPDEQVCDDIHTDTCKYAHGT